MLIKTLRIGLPCSIVAAGLLMTSVSSAKPEYMKREAGTKCVTCHVTMGKKDLNDTGKCYKEHDHKLEACKAK